MNKTKIAYLQLHFAVLLFGFTAILGDLIQLSPPVLVWWRLIIACLSFVFIIKVFETFKSIGIRQTLIYSGIGIFISLQWITFFASVHASNASVTLVSMATTSFFAALLEPLIFKRRIVFLDVFIGLLIIPAMALIVNNLDVSMRTGVLFGIISAVFAALYSILNKKFIITGKEKEITFIELGAALIFLSICLPVYLWFNKDLNFIPSTSDWIYLSILATACTILAYVLTLKSLNHLSAFAATLTINIEPIYGILLALVILKEHNELTLNFYFGAGFIVLIVLIYPVIIKKIKNS